MSTYKPDNNWSDPLDGWYVTDCNGETIAKISLHACDVIETYSDGETVTWRDGAHQVRIATDLTPKPRNRTFVGESAWFDARNYAEATYQQMRIAI